MESPEWVYDIQYLVFSGGGILGYAYAGAILALDNAFLQRNQNLYQQIKGLSGASIGASFALMLALGIRGHNLYREIFRIQPARVMDDFNLENLVEMYGISPKTYFIKSIYDILERYTGNGKITFKDLYTLTQKHLVISVSNVTTAQVEYHSYLTTPQYPVVESVCASMAIPIIFAPSIISNGDLLVDGGLMDNMPFSMFPPELTLMLTLRSNMPEPTSLGNYIRRILMMTMNNIEEIMMRSLPPELMNRRIILRLRDVSAIQFNITPSICQRLIRMGMRTMSRFLHPKILIRECVKQLLKTCYILNQTSQPVSPPPKHPHHTSPVKPEEEGEGVVVAEPTGTEVLKALVMDWKRHVGTTTSSSCSAEWTSEERSPEQ